MWSALGKGRVAWGTLEIPGRPTQAGHKTKMGSYSKRYGETLHRFKLENSRVCFIYLENHVGCSKGEKKATWYQ